MAFYVTPTYRLRRRAWVERPYHDGDDAEATHSDVFVPVNVRAEGDDFIITAPLPGVKAEDLSIQVMNETVTIQGELKDPSQDGEQNGARFLVRETPSGRFYRVIRLPDQLDSAKAEASLVNGLLTLRVPKAEEARPKTIKVNAVK